MMIITTTTTKATTRIERERETKRVGSHFLLIYIVVVLFIYYDFDYQFQRSSIYFKKNIIMAVIQRRPNQQGLPSSIQTPLTVLVFLVFFTLLFYIATVPEFDPDVDPTKPLPSLSEMEDNFKHKNYKQVVSQAEQRLRSSLTHKRQLISKALDKLTTSSMPARLKTLRDSNQIVGENLKEIKAGKETVQELLHAASTNNIIGQNDNNNYNNNNMKPPMTLEEITGYFGQWLHKLHNVLQQNKRAPYETIWQVYHDLTVKTLYVWDREYLSRMPPRRNDGSIFLSLATYRDENCLNTVQQAYEKAANPDKLFIGLVQQNCHSDCMSGVLEGGGMEPVEPDQDCYKAYCELPEGQEKCANGQLRLLDIDEDESLGPYAARYFASKLWYGEQWFMQTDAHMTFAQNWDAISIDMLQKAPSDKPVLSHYPPSHMVDLEAISTKPASRLCGPMFATSDLEAQIVRLEGGAEYDKVQSEIPKFAPFTAAGYFVAHSDFLREVPFDPFLPYIFMGEEIIMSTRLWTSGYDIFSPTRSVVGHIYVRRHKPKFWESVHRALSPGVHNPLQAMILERIKYQLGYPEAAKDMLEAKTLLTAVEQYSMGTERSLDRYMELIGLNMTTKEVTITHWCEDGKVPPGFEELAHLYETE